MVRGWSVIAAHRKPEELAGDRDVHDGRALAVIDEMAVAVMQSHLRLPRALVGLLPRRWAPRRVAVMPRGLDQESAGVMVAGAGDVAAVLLIS